MKISMVLILMTSLVYAQNPSTANNKHGKVIDYYESGQVSKIVEYSDGLKHGNETEYDELGNQISISVYDSGVLKDFKRCSDGRFGNEKLVCIKLELPSNKGKEI